MKVYVVFLLQFIAWSGFTLTEWLSKHDHPIFNAAMFFVFFYLAINVSNKVVKSRRKTCFITSSSLLLYWGLHFLLSLL